MPGSADYSADTDRSSPGENSTPSRSIFQLFLYTIYLMAKSSVIPYFMAISRPMIRGNGFVSLSMRALPPPSLEGHKDASTLPPLCLCVPATPPGSATLAHVRNFSSVHSWPHPHSSNPTPSLTKPFSPWPPLKQTHLSALTFHRSCQ